MSSASAAVLYADLAESTALVNEHSDSFAAEVYKAFLHCASKISVEPAPGSLPVTKELNYLYEPGHPQHMFSGGKDLDAVLVKNVRRMMKSSVPSSSSRS